MLLICTYFSEAYKNYHSYFMYLVKCSGTSICGHFTNTLTIKVTLDRSKLFPIVKNNRMLYGHHSIKIIFGQSLSVCNSEAGLYTGAKYTNFSIPPLGDPHFKTSKIIKLIYCTYPPLNWSIIRQFYTYAQFKNIISVTFTLQEKFYFVVLVVHLKSP